MRMLALVPLALADDTRETRVIPWFTVTALSTAGVELQWKPDDAPIPALGGGLGVMAGPAALFFSRPKDSPEKFPKGARIDLGLSGGFLALWNVPRAGEAMTRTLGGYLRAGQMDEAGQEQRETLALGWRSDGDAGQLDVLLIGEKRIFPPVALAAQARMSVGNEAMPWGLGLGGAVMLGL